MKSEDIESKIKNFISTQFGTSINKIGNNDSLFHDLGIDGDDAIELIQKYSEIFSVSIENFDMSKYFGSEVSSSPFQSIIHLFKKSKYNDVPRLTVSDLIKGTKTGKLT